MAEICISCVECNATLDIHEVNTNYGDFNVKIVPCECVKDEE